MNAMVSDQMPSLDILHTTKLVSFLLYFCKFP
jgi:hypothetical protein